MITVERSCLGCDFWLSVVSNFFESTRARASDCPGKDMKTSGGAKLFEGRILSPS